uniref:Uncharacterized protein n=1 Tax=Pithovirus LCDPAC01 TaxID=2506600 RepID=A0A481YNH5_9VIRU|nr:MAG: hypothetical protein LCDPAC01_01280 [Pithovirus LCDPAC01]
MDIVFDKYIKQNPEFFDEKLDLLIGRKFTFNVISKGKNHIEVAENVFIAGTGFSPVFKATIVEVVPFLIIGPVERIPLLPKTKHETKISMENRVELVEQAIYDDSIEEFSKYLNEDLYNS